MGNKSSPRCWVWGTAPGGAPSWCENFARSPILHGSRGRRRHNLAKTSTGFSSSFTFSRHMAVQATQGSFSFTSSPGFTGSSPFCRCLFLFLFLSLDLSFLLCRGSLDLLGEALWAGGRTLQFLVQSHIRGKWVLFMVNRSQAWALYRTCLKSGLKYCPIDPTGLNWGFSQFRESTTTTNQPTNKPTNQQTNNKKNARTARKTRITKIQMCVGLPLPLPGGHFGERCR